MNAASNIGDRILKARSGLIKSLFREEIDDKSLCDNLEELRKISTSAASLVRAQWHWQMENGAVAWSTVGWNERLGRRMETA